MKSIIKTHITVLITVLFPILFISVLANQTFAQVNGPKITFNETKHNFGKVREGVEVTYQFKFRNEGEKNLVIQKVQASCGCTGASVGDKKEFKKDEAGEIKVTFNTSGRSGVQSKTVSVKSNDPANPVVALLFTCEIISKQSIVTLKKDDISK
ncbi:MAG: DUF1573 domain-containing protein [Melioribacteraceae bacterium]|jgi:hypothetical protein|nr:DUF1573 domain-containing protein [Melioribacteraceae bacterium]